MSPAKIKEAPASHGSSTSFASNASLQISRLRTALTGALHSTAVSRPSVAQDGEENKLIHVIEYNNSPTASLRLPQSENFETHVQKHAFDDVEVEQDENPVRALSSNFDRAAPPALAAPAPAPALAPTAFITLTATESAGAELEKADRVHQRISPTCATNNQFKCPSKSLGNIRSVIVEQMNQVRTSIAHT